MPSADVDALRARVARRVRELAARRGLTLIEVADRAGVSRAAFWTALAGRSGPSIDYLAKVARALGVDPVELVRPYRS